MNLTDSRFLECGNGAGDSVASGSVVETNSAVAPSSSLRLVDSSWPPSRTLTGHLKSKLCHSFTIDYLTTHESRIASVGGGT